MGAELRNRVRTQCNENQSCVFVAKQLIQYEYIKDVLDKYERLFEFCPVSVANGVKMQPPKSPKCHARIQSDSVQAVIANRAVNVKSDFGASKSLVRSHWGIFHLDSSTFPVTFIFSHELMNGNQHDLRSLYYATQLFIQIAENHLTIIATPKTYNQASGSRLSISIGNGASLSVSRKASVTRRKGNTSIQETRGDGSADKRKDKAVQRDSDGSDSDSNSSASDLDDREITIADEVLKANLTNRPLQTSAFWSRSSKLKWIILENYSAKRNAKRRVWQKLSRIPKLITISSKQNAPLPNQHGKMCLFIKASLALWRQES